MGYRPGKAERTKAQLGEAIIALLATMSPDRVTAEAIAKRAGMGRATWFRHFSSKSDAVACALVARWKRWAAKEAPSLGPQAGLLPFLRMVHGQKETIALLYARGMRQSVMDASTRFAETLVSGGQTGYREKFYLYGFVGILDEWVERGFAETPEEVAALLDGFGGLVSHEPPQPAPEAST